MASDFDPYRILDVDASAGQEQIDEAYRRQWAAYPSDPAPESRLREIQAAYRVLSDPAERRSYDERRATRPSAGVAVAEMPPTQSAPRDPDVPAWRPSDVARAIGAVIGLTFLALVVFGLAGAAVAGGADEIENDAAGMTLELVASLCFQAAALGSVYWFGIRKYGLSWRSVGWRAPEKSRAWFPFVLVIMAMALQAAYGLILAALDVEPDTDLPDTIFDNAVPLILLLITTIAVAPVVEETFFRGFIFGGLRRHWGLVWAGLFSSVLFGLAHVGNPGYFYLLPLVAMLGGIFAWGYYYTKSLYTTIAAHMIFNSIAMIITLATR
jgi:membrane protease YdiL (CAAX protease family)